MTDKASAVRFGNRLAAAALALGIGGCSMFGEPNEVVVSCPTTGILAAGELLERYTEGSERDLTNLIVRARVSNLANACSILKDEREVEMDLVLQVSTERGPAAVPGQQQVIEYFVAVADGQNRILSRREFPLAATFEGNARQAVFKEELFLSIPIPDSRRVSDYRVIVGLQLTEAELRRVLSENDKR